MQKRIGLFVFVVLFGLVGFFVRDSHAFIFISELLADPPAGVVGDSNQDGVTSSTQDEFVELVNLSITPLDISGWSISDAISTRHVFLALTVLNPNQFMVVFGGGAPNLPGLYWQKASSGTLSLNNTAETVSLYDNHLSLIDQLVYGSIGGQDQSIGRAPLSLDGSLVLHSQIPGSNGRIYSPGTDVNGQLQASSSAVPEPNTLVFFLAFLCFMGITHQLKLSLIDR